MKWKKQSEDLMQQTLRNCNHKGKEMPSDKEVDRCKTCLHYFQGGLPTMAICRKRQLQALSSSNNEKEKRIDRLWLVVLGFRKTISESVPRAVFYCVINVVKQVVFKEIFCWVPSYHMWYVTVVIHVTR